MPRQKSKKSPATAGLTINQRFFYPYSEPDWSLIVKRDDPRLELNWPPQGFENADCPLNDSLDALRQWLDFLIRPGGVVRCGVTAGLVANSWGTWLRDTMLLIEHHRAKGTITLARNITTAQATANDAIAELIRVRDVIFPAARPPRAKRRRSPNKVATQKGIAGRRGYPLEALSHAKELRAKHPSMKAHSLRQECLKKFAADDLPPDADSFRRWLNRPRANKPANRAN